MEREQTPIQAPPGWRAAWLLPFPSRSSLKVDVDFRVERGVFAGLEIATIARFGFVAVRGGAWRATGSCS